ncbi:two-component sensor histidine kinase [Anabaena sphaerica FACHB-251]|uniref:histidine kinase n=1 Tax=Anabaena sphaerica FACHB-251 TaxID=2692883 RepID=A0A927A0V6_9NOST|nr:two-component system sensor histidine kinase RppB [Anabaena sphaerica]MBD2293646.1 two-component sensor histidine kinase [Anabaena sphaerica FACHB-251]
MNQNQLFKLTRWRLALWYTGIMGVILSLCGFGLYEAIAHAHWVALNEELKSVAGTLHDSMEPTLKQPGKIETATKRLLPELCLAETDCLQKITTSSKQRHVLGALHQGDYYINLQDVSGKSVAIAGFPILTNQRYQKITLSLHTKDNRDWGNLIVERSLKDYDDYLAATRLILFLGLPFSMLLVGGASLWLAARAMQPVYTSYEQMQQFTADAAHELRTPLAAIQATVESALRSNQLSDVQARDILTRVERQNQRLSQLVKDLLLLSRMDQQALPLKYQECYLDDLVSDIAEEFAALAIAAEVQLKTEIRQEKIKVLGDEEQLYRLLSNLVVNAIQYTLAGGEVKIILDSNKHHAIIQVEDTGLGIAPEHQTQIFTRFWRVNSDRSRHTGGSGLGLPIANAIAIAHQGTLEVNSSLNKGSIFTLRLPY